MVCHMVPSRQVDSSSLVPYPISMPTLLYTPALFPALCLLPCRVMLSVMLRHG
jgi:hypothetical protein